MKTQKTSLSRKLAIQGFDLAAGGHNFFGLLEFDISRLRPTLRQARREGKGGSLYAFFLKAVGHTVASEPLFNAFIDYRRTTTFDTVDIAVPIEISTSRGVENRQYVLRDVVHKTVSQIADEMDAAKRDQSSATGFLDSKFWQDLLGTLPRSLVAWLFRRALRDHGLVKNLSGTLFVTSVSMYLSVPGFIVPYIGGPKAASFAFGSVYKKPVVVSDAIVIREIVSVTAVFNHDLIDGAPAARFIGKLKRLIETDSASLLG